MPVGLGTPLAKGRNKFVLCIQILLYILVLLCILSSGSSVLACREARYNGCWVWFLPQKLVLLVLETLQLSGRTENYSIFIALALVQKYEIQVIP